MNDGDICECGHARRSHNRGRGICNASVGGFGYCHCARFKADRRAAAQEPAWVPVAERLPAFGERVEVRGHHTPDGHGWPISYRREIYGSRKIPTKTPGVYESGSWIWESTEWRGTCGLTHWRPIPKTKLDALKGRP